MKLYFRIIFFLSIILLLTIDTFAVSYIVDNSEEMGAGTFHQAILDANANPGADDIIFNISDTITFNVLQFDNVNYLPSIEDSVVIIGNNVTLIGEGSRRFFEINAYTYIEDITFEGGYAKLVAGALKINNSNAFLENCTFLENYAEGLSGVNISGWGGAVSLSEGALTLSSCYFEVNQGLTRGGAIYITTMSDLTIIDTDFFENSINNEHNIIYAGGESSINIISISLDQGDFTIGSDIVLDNTSDVTFSYEYEIEEGEMIEVKIE